MSGAAPPPEPARARLARWLGWAAGGLAGVAANYGVWEACVERGLPYPVEPTTFAAFVAGAFGGMALAPRLGRRAAPVLASALAVVLVVVVVLLAAR